jgi:hypothetical protein
MVTLAKPRVNVAELREREASLAAQLEDVRGRVAAYPELIQEARVQTVYAGPKRPGGDLTGAVRKLSEKERKDVASLRELQGDLAAVRSVLEREAQREAEHALAHVRTQDEQYRAAQSDVLKRAGTAFVDLVRAWGEFCAQVEEHAQTRENAARSLPPNLSQHLLAESAPLLLTPTPKTFEAFVRMMTDATLDPNKRGYREGVEGGGVRLDLRQALVGLTPDLRGQVRRAELPGNLTTTET